MAEIYQTKNFLVDTPERPLVSRLDGGHVRISIKGKVLTDRTKLEPSVAVELMRLSVIVGEAFEKAMNVRGIPVIKVNYQDMGNWAFKTGDRPYMHYHLFGRATNAVKQPWPESVNLPDRGTGFYEGFESLNVDDVKEIQKQIVIAESQDKFRPEQWRLI